MSAVRYPIDFACRDTEPFQRFLNELYAYRDDLETKVLHRSRLNLFSLLVSELIRTHQITNFGTALDIGCNAGLYSAMLADFGFRHVLGVDIVPGMVATAERHFGVRSVESTIEFRVQSAEALAGEGPFDFLLCTEVIEHTSEPERVIENIRGLLAPGGVAVISLPNRISLPYLEAWLAYRIKRRRRDEDFERHLEFPFYRSMRLFTGDDRRLVRVDGTNLFWDGRLLGACYGKSWFPAVNRAAFTLARQWPFRYVAQFFYVVVKRAG